MLLHGSTSIIFITLWMGYTFFWRVAVVCTQSFLQLTFIMEIKEICETTVAQINDVLTKTPSLLCFHCWIPHSQNRMHHHFVYLHQLSTLHLLPLRSPHLSSKLTKSHWRSLFLYQKSKVHRLTNILLHHANKLCQQTSILLHHANKLCQQTSLIFDLIHNYFQIILSKAGGSPV